MYMYRALCIHVHIQSPLHVLYRALCIHVHIQGSIYRGLYTCTYTEGTCIEGSIHVLYRALYMYIYSPLYMYMYRGLCICTCIEGPVYVHV